uniref:Ig-like domain-containing protein n=1 Tax=Pygocentrus nattereri TaxID=42514 RepID=A0A3B4BYG4_PYGNA
RLYSFIIDVLNNFSVQLIQVHQTPKELILSPGSSLKVSCSVNGTDYPNLYWYQWTPAAGFTLVFTSVSVGSVDPSSNGQFKSQRPEKLQIDLESDAVSESDSAVWYCAASLHSIPD